MFLIRRVHAFLLWNEAKKIPKINLSQHGALQSLIDNSHNLKSKLHVVPTSFSTFVNMPKQCPQTKLPWRLNHFPLNNVICTVDKDQLAESTGELWFVSFCSNHKKYIFNLQTHQHKPLQQVQIFTWERETNNV